MVSSAEKRFGKPHILTAHLSIATRSTYDDLETDESSEDLPPFLHDEHLIFATSDAAPVSNEIILFITKISERMMVTIEK